MVPYGLALQPGFSRSGFISTFKSTLHPVTIFSNADLFLITSVDPITCTSCFLRKSASSLVTVSRDDPIICAISSCVSVSLIRTWPFSSG